MKLFLQFILFIAVAAAVVFLMKRVYETAYLQGYNKATSIAQSELDNMVALVRNGAISYKNEVSNNPTPTPEGTKATIQKPKVIKWTGPELWDAVNKRRIDLGVNPLSQRDEICTLASIRLNQLLELGKLDGHQGFSEMPDKRPDLKWIYEKYNLSEFLVSGADTPEEAVKLWEDTLGHKKLLTGGEYVWGCIYAQSSFGVAIAAY